MREFLRLLTMPDADIKATLARLAKLFTNAPVTMSDIPGLPSAVALPMRSTRITYGPWTNTNGFELGKTEFIKEFTISLDKIKPYTNFRIRVKRVTGVNIAIRDESQGQSQSYLQAIFAYSNDIINYSNSAVAGIRIDSTDFDTIPDRSYLARGMKIQVPTNYLTREETGGAAAYTRNITTGANTGSETRWDGKFRGDIADVSWREEEGHVNYDKVYTNNPAWVYYDIVTNNRYGLGDFVGARRRRPPRWA